MAFKPSKNPQVIEATKTSKKRSYALGNIDLITRPDGLKGCMWCGDDLKSKHPNTRYCKDPLCSKSAWAWGNPQGQEGRNLLLERQDFKCNICQFDWLPFKKSLLRGNMFGIPQNKCPEVDHIIAIGNGGASLGLDNHQAICYDCHKSKTKVDVKSMPKKTKKTHPVIKCSSPKCRKHARYECSCGLKMCNLHFNIHFSEMLKIPNSLGPQGNHKIVAIK